MSHCFCFWFCFFFFYCLGSNLFFVLNSKSRKKIFKCVMLWLFIFKGSAVWGSNTCLPLMEIVLGQFPKLPLHQTVNTHLSKGHKGIIKAQLESDNGTALLLCDSILICRLLKLNVRHCFLIREETVKGWEYNKGRLALLTLDFQMLCPTLPVTVEEFNWYQRWFLKLIPDQVQGKKILWKRKW